MNRTGVDRSGHEWTGVDTSGHLFSKKIVDEIWGRRMREAYEEGGDSEVEFRV
jgi:hypothetical protein